MSKKVKQVLIYLFEMIVFPVILILIFRIISGFGLEFPGSSTWKDKFETYLLYFTGYQIFVVLILQNLNSIKLDELITLKSILKKEKIVVNNLNLSISVYKNTIDDVLEELSDEKYMIDKVKIKQISDVRNKFYRDLENSNITGLDKQEYEFYLDACQEDIEQQIDHYNLQWKTSILLNLCK